MVGLPASALLIDTHAWVWRAVSPEKLSSAARQLIDSAPTVGLSAISPWEIAIKHASGKFEPNVDIRVWMQKALDLRRTTLIPISPEIAVRSSEIRPTIMDPADAIIIATALTYRWPLITADARIRASGLVECIW